MKKILFLLFLVMVSCAPSIKVVKLENQLSADVKKYIFTSEDADEWLYLHIIMEESMIGSKIIVKDATFKRILFDKVIQSSGKPFAAYIKADNKSCYLDLQINGLHFAIPINTVDDYRFLIVKKEKKEYILTYTNQRTFDLPI